MSSYLLDPRRVAGCPHPLKDPSVRSILQPKRDHDSHNPRFFSVLVRTADLVFDH